jgi:hypothetical protein
MLLFYISEPEDHHAAAEAMLPADALIAEVLSVAEHVRRMALDAIVVPEEQPQYH